jgi:recombination protein RecR
MSRSKIPLPLQTLMTLLRKIPGVGAKSAERYAFQLLEWEESSLALLAQSIGTLRSLVISCPECHCLKAGVCCDFCQSDKRDTKTLCIVSSAKDVYPIEDTQTFRGLYHVLEGLFSPLEGFDASRIDTAEIRKRVDQHGIQDILLALDSTIEGDATALFLKEEMKHWNVTISRLAFGIPLGSALDYVDPGTLARALLGRHTF